MKKEKETKKANNLKATQILDKLAESTLGLLPTNLGTKKSNIYKEALFEGCSSEKEKKHLRIKFRKNLLSVAKGVVSETNKEKQQKLVASFVEFYKSAYKINDYSLSSVCNENLSSEKKDILQKALNICKKSF